MCFASERLLVQDTVAYGDLDSRVHKHTEWREVPRHGATHCICSGKHGEVVLHYYSIVRDILTQPKIVLALMHEARYTEWHFNVSLTSVNRRIRQPSSVFLQAIMEKIETNARLMSC